MKASSVASTIPPTTAPLRISITGKHAQTNL
jgi:hypothetical protein